MKISSINSAQSRQNFNGIRNLPNVSVRNAADAISQWAKLADGAFTKIGVNPREEAVFARVRQENFSFLDRLTSNEDKHVFIEEFKRVTGFPDLDKVSQKIKDQFSAALEKAAKSMKENILGITAPEVAMTSKAGKFDIAIAGYNPNSSVGLGKALPGSDLNDTFALFNSDYFPGELAALRKTFAEKIVNNSDHRILSFNHKHARPVTMDIKEYVAMLNEMSMVTESELAPHYNALLNKRMGFMPFNPQDISGSNPSFVNLFLTSKMPDAAVAGHDVAVVTEGIRDGIKVVANDAYLPQLSETMNRSFFSWCTNMLQIHGLEQVLGGEVPFRDKIIARGILKDFEKWPIAKKFDCVKSVVKNMSDNNPVSGEFQGLLKDANPAVENSRNALRQIITLGMI